MIVEHSFWPAPLLGIKVQCDGTSLSVHLVALEKRESTEEAAIGGAQELACIDSNIVAKGQQTKLIDFRY